jgi:hypothetical protein
MGSSEREWPKTIHVCPTCGEQFPPEQANDCCNKDGHDLRDVVAVRVVPVVERGPEEGLADDIDTLRERIAEALWNHEQKADPWERQAVDRPPVRERYLAKADAVLPVVERGPEEAMHGYRAGWDAAMRSLGVPIDKRGPLEERERSGDIEEQFSDVLDNMGVIAKGAYDGWRNDLIAALCEVVRGQESFNGLTRAEIEATLSAPEGMADLPREEER